MRLESLPIEKILNILQATPQQIAELTENQLLAAPGPGEWSANEVLAHLRSCAEVWETAL